MLSTAELRTTALCMFKTTKDLERSIYESLTEEEKDYLYGKDRKKAPVGVVDSEKDKDQKKSSSKFSFTNLKEKMKKSKSSEKVEPKEEAKPVEKTTEKPSEEKKEEAKSKAPEVVKEEAKPTEKPSEKKEAKPAAKVQTKEEQESKVDVKVGKPKVNKDEDKITMQQRSTCPVKVKTKTKQEKKEIKKNVKQEQDQKEEEHRLLHLVEHLKSKNVNFTPPLKMPTGLYELQIFQKSGNPVLVSVDINGLLYCDEIKFFIGRVMPGQEYDKGRPVIMMTDKSLEALINNEQIPEKYTITESLFTLNKVLDLQTLKEKDPKKREKVFETCGKIISDKELYENIVKAAGGEPWRFAFSRYNSVNDFSIVSSKKNLASNLANDKLFVTKEIWINFKDKQVNLTSKSYS